MLRETYEATVRKNDDDENRGRIKVTCVGLLGDNETELPMWVEPKYQWGWFTVPDIGEVVEIELTNSTETDESYGQSSIDVPDIQWTGVRYYTDNAEEDNAEPTEIHPDFLENYGKRRGFSTPLGHVFLFDDTSGKSKVYITWVKEKDGDKSQILIDDDGSVSFDVLGKNTLHLQSGPVFEIKLDNGAALKIENKDALATTTLGSGAVSATIAEHMEVLWTSMKTAVEAHINAHKHPSGLGETGPPTSPLVVPPWTPIIKSSKLKFPDL